MWTQLLSSIFGVVFKELLALWTMDEIVEYKEASDVDIIYDTKTIIDKYAWFEEEDV